MLHVPVFFIIKSNSKYTQIYNKTSSSKRCYELVIIKICEYFLSNIIFLELYIISNILLCKMNIYLLFILD